MPKSAGNSNVEKLQTGKAQLLILLVGINQYDDTKINNLNYCVNDCQELKAALEISTKLFTNKTIIIHHDNTPASPLLDVVKNSLEKLVSQATKEDTILIYFSGHGFLDKQTQQPILCLKNTETNNLTTTGLPVAEILQKLAESGAKYQLIFIDACHSGGTSINFQHLSESKKLSESETSSIAPQLIELFWQRAAKSKGFYALLSCDKYEQSEEWKNLKHGLFTYYLIQGFLGKAADKSGVIEADSLYKYVYHRTLEYIDKTNQQIRLTNQQKANRGESNIQSESPGQTPLRIVEGAGEFVLGIVPINSNENSRRQAVIINGLAGCEETVSLSGVLHSRGEFVVGYWPRTDRSWQDVKDGILECLNIDPPSLPSSHSYPSSPSPHSSPSSPSPHSYPSSPSPHSYPSSPSPHSSPSPPSSHSSPSPHSSHSPHSSPSSPSPHSSPSSPSPHFSPSSPSSHPSPSSPSPHTQLETAFLYIRGEVETIINDDNEHEHYLVLGDGVRISCFWLQRQLWNSQVRQQAIILDFPNAENNVLNEWVEYLHQEKNKSQCIIASSSLEFSQELVKILGNAQHGLTVAGLVIELQQRLKITTYLSGNAIDVLLPGEATNTIFDANICPYKGLEAFRQQDAEFFFGRQKLIQEILARLRDSSFLAVVGASGSGKSSVVQAGVLPQLTAGKQPPGKCWCGCFRPGETPINALAQVLATDGKVDEMEASLHLRVEWLVLWLRRRVEPMVVLVVDQFEELFTLTAEKERLEFLNLLLGALRETSDKLRLIITLRDDFIGNCLEVPELEVLVEDNLMLVSPNLGEEEYRDAIVKPAEKVGLKVESGLVDVLLDGVQEELGGLPLLQFVLRELWEKRRDGMLSLQVYQEVVKGFKEVLENKANKVFKDLSEEEKSCAQFIFLELVQLGEKGKDTRRRVLKSELLGKKYEKGVMESVLKKLGDARLIVVGGKVESGGKGENVEENVAESVEENLGKLEITVEVAHEILIRHWSTLRWWLDNNRSRLQQQRQMEQDAKKWVQHGRVDDFLLRGVALQNGEELYIKYSDELSELTQEFIEAGMALRQRQEEEKRQRRRRTVLGLVSGLVAVSVFAVGAVWQWRSAVVEKRNAVLKGDISTLEYVGATSLERQLDVIALGKKLKAGWVSLENRMSGIVLLQQTFDFEKWKEFKTLEGHKGGAAQVIFSPDGKLLASGSRDKTVFVWQVDGTNVATLQGHKDLVYDVSFSPDGKLLASGSRDGTVRVWLPDGTEVATLQGHKDWVHHVSFSPDGKLLASGSRDGIVRLWQVDGTPIATLDFSSVNCVSFSPDGKLLASGSGDGIVRLWQTDGTPVATLEGHKGTVGHVIFSPDGKLLASANSDGRVRLWQVDGTLAATLDGHQGTVSHVSFSSDGKLLASAGWDGTVRVWQTDGTPIATLDGHKDWVHHVSFSPDGKLLASAGGTVRLWQVDDTPVATLDGHKYWVSHVSFSPDGKLLASASGDGTVRLWQTDGTPVATLDEHKGAVYHVIFSPDGKLLASASPDLTVRVWQTDGTPVATLDGHKIWLYDVSFSPDGKLLASGSGDGTVHMWQTDGTLVATLEGHKDRVRDVSFSPDGKLLASASDDGTVRVWQTDGTLVVNLEEHKDRVFHVGFSPDGKLLASVSLDGTVRVWQTDGTPVTTLEGHKGSVQHISFSPDGKLLASGSEDATVRLWQTNGTHVATLEGHKGFVNYVIFSPDGKLLASASSDGTVRLWQTNGATIATLEGHKDLVRHVSFSPDGKLLASASTDGTLRLWNFDLDSLLKQGCDWVGDHLRNNPNVSEEDKRLCEGIE